jgi:hypothetical protein
MVVMMMVMQIVMMVMVVVLGDPNASRFGFCGGGFVFDGGERLSRIRDGLKQFGKRLGRSQGWLIPHSGDRGAGRHHGQRRRCAQKPQCFLVHFSSPMGCDRATFGNVADPPKFRPTCGGRI